MDPKLRQRGWSLSSNSSHPSSPPKSSTTTGTTSSSSIVVVGHANPNNNDSNSNHHDNNDNHNNSHNTSDGHCTTRPRSNTDYSEDTLGTVEKMELLQSYPTHHSDDDDHDDDGGHVDELYDNVGSHEEDDDNDDNDDDNDDDAVQDAADGEEEDDDVMEMFGDSESDTGDTIHDEMLQPQKKRMKLDSSCSTERETDLRWSGIIENTVIDNEHKNEHRNEHKDDKEERLQRAKDKMSKWAKRLFDPNRPRGLVETPEYIPLNDEFLAQFGKREREYYERVGDKIELDKDDNLDDVDDDISQEDKGEGEDEIKHSKDHNVRKDKQGGTKVKISNLAYTTTEQALTRLCETYGPVMEIKLPTDENNPSRSKGRAYVTFQLHSDAEGFLQDMHEKVFEGRILRIVPAADRPSASSSSSKLGGGRDSLGGGMVGGMGGKKRTRYWEKNDITTKCFRCGQVGHMVTSCPNDEIAKPCPLCAKTGHDSYSCPLNKICFNCGVPGHINRECPERRGMPRRMVCGACFISGHHKWECRERVHAIPSYGAKCMVCGIDGHFMCTDMKWFFGLRGISCFNCGRKGHHGSMCDRPTVDECARNSDVLLKELEFAEAKSIEDELEEVRQRRRDEQYERERGRRRLDSNGDRDRKRDRAKSQPASRFRPNNNQSSRYGRL